MVTEFIDRAEHVGIRRILTGDLDKISQFPFTVSIAEPLNDRRRLEEAFAVTTFWTRDAGAVAIIELATQRVLGTSQYYRSGPCIHGLELGYILHHDSDRGKGHARAAVRMFSDYLFKEKADLFRQQLLIETWNSPSLRLADRCGFTREGLLRSSGLGASDPGDSVIYSRTRKDWHEEQQSLYGAKS